jgi:hypothetical protein
MGDIEELVDLVLTGQHPRLRERCIVDRIVSVLEDPPNFLRLRRLKKSRPCGPPASISYPAQGIRAQIACEFLKGDS